MFASTRHLCTPLLQLIPLLGPENYVPVLACNDKCIRVLSGAQAMFEVPTAAVPTCIKYVADSHDHQHR